MWRRPAHAELRFEGPLAAAEAERLRGLLAASPGVVVARVLDAQGVALVGYEPGRTGPAELVTLLAAQGRPVRSARAPNRCALSPGNARNACC